MDPLPASTGVVVIGGGVAGVSAALCLAEWGVPVLLCEKGRVAAEQSSRNWGWIRKQGRDPAELPLMLESVGLWRRWAEEAAEPTGFQQGGCLYLAETDREMAGHAAWLESAKGFQLDTQLLDAAGVDRVLGRADRAFKGGLYTPSDAQAEPKLAVPALARLAQRRGAVIREGCAVRAVLREGGRVTGVMTEHGPVKADAVILAGGAWSRTFMENLGLSLPQLGIRASALRTQAAPDIATGVAALGGAAASLRRRGDGGYTVARAGAARFDLIPAAFRHFVAYIPTIRRRWGILKIRAGAEFFGPLGRHRWAEDEASPFEACRVMDPAPDPALLDDVLAGAQRLHPGLKSIRPAETWGGLIDVTPDEIPVIDSVAGAPGLVVATGLSGHGFGLGPGVGLLAAQLATGRAPVTDPARFRLARFG
jgi:glycine/D-amino acid oxidase-like deaminating enzyme